MQPSFCVEPDAGARQQLLALARQALSAGQHSDLPLQVNRLDYPQNLSVDAAVFVTLTRDGALRGCVGSRDRRFDALAADEIDALEIEISLLSEMVPMAVRDRAELLAQLEPGRDGLLIEDRGMRATFLPRVWQSIPQAEDFVGQLMLKAGLPAAYWSSSIRCSRYHCLSFAEI